LARYSGNHSLFFGTIPCGHEPNSRYEKNNISVDIDEKKQREKVYEKVCMNPDNSELKTTATFTAKLFLAFLRLGLTAFGGPAMIPYIRVLAVRKNAWLTEESFKHGVAVCQSIPGATAMQVAAYVGLRAGGMLGAVATYVGFGFPAFLLMVALAALYDRAHDLAAVISAFNGLQVIVVALVANATVSFGHSTIKKRQDLLLGLGVAAFLTTQGSRLSQSFFQPL